MDFLQECRSRELIGLIELIELIEGSVHPTVSYSIKLRMLYLQKTDNQISANSAFSA